MAADPHPRRGTPWWLNVSLVTGLLALGVLWGRTASQVEGKLPAERFVADSIRRSAEADAMRRDVGDLLAEIRETNGRLREIVCTGRAGCR